MQSPPEGRDNEMATGRGHPRRRRGLVGGADVKGMMAGEIPEGLVYCYRCKAWTFGKCH